MDQEIFSDGIGQVTIIGGVARLDFVSYSPVEKDSKGQPVAVFRQRIVMSLDGFMQSAAKFQEAAQAVVKLAQRPRDAQSTQAGELPGAAPISGTEPAPATQKRPFP
jgi:hypothetical protein